MPAAMQEFFDIHVHANSRSTEDFERLARTGCRGILAVSDEESGFSTSESLFDFFRRLATVDVPRARRAGLDCRLALGIHPRGIPARGHELALEQLAKQIEMYSACAIGETGLETGSEIEREVLLGQLELASKLDLPVIVHTPRAGKLERLEQVIDLVSQSGIRPERVCIDHLDEATMEVAARTGCWLGLSVHPAKLSPRQAAECVARYGAERIILSSDLGANRSWLFALPAAAGAMQEAGLPPELAEAVVLHNPLAFCGIEH